MSSFYCVVKYVPNPIAEESTNIGVIVFGHGVVRSRFVTRWQKAQVLGGEDLSFLKRFVDEIRSATKGQRTLFEDMPQWSDETITRIARTWHNSIQLTRPRASLRDPDELLHEVVNLYLSPRPAERLRRPFRTKRAAVSAGRRSLFAVVEKRHGTEAAQRLELSKVKVVGSLDTHDFDIGMRSGHLLLAAQGLSFQLPDRVSIETEIQLTAWAADDVRKKFPHLPLAVLAVPPLSPTPTFERAQRIFSGLNVDLVESWGDSLQAWAESTIDRLYI